VVSGLDDLWPIAYQSLLRFFRRADDGHMARFMGIRICVHNNNQISAIGFRLGTPCAADFQPALFLRFVTSQPTSLRVGQQLLAVFRWTKQIDAHLFSRSRGEGTAVSVLVRTFVGSAAIWFTRFPVHMLMGEPKRFDVHGIEYSGKPLSCRGDFTAAGLMPVGRDGWRGCREQEYGPGNQSTNRS
jgi:hypothetical protein